MFIPAGYRTLAVLFAVVLAVCATAAALEPIDLSGKWQVRLDPDRSFEPGDLATDAAGFEPVQLPGALRESELGHLVGPDTQWIGMVRDEVWNEPQYAPYHAPDNFKVPFWLQPNRHYVGRAWYGRSVEIPDTWSGQRILLRLERPHWLTSVWVDGRRAGEGESLATPHVFDLTQVLSPGKHTLAVCIDNGLETIDVGLNSHSVSDHTQTAWHGIVGRIELVAGPRVAIENVEVYPAEDAKSARLQVRLANATDAPRQEVLIVRATDGGKPLGEKEYPVDIPAGGTSQAIVLPFDRQAPTWDEFDPKLCELEIQFKGDAAGEAAWRGKFGVRHVGTDGRRLTLNGHRLFLRGTLECCIFPLTGYPPTDIDSWKRIIRICKAHGLNHIRFHSWCPPEAAFLAADELGFYYQVECSTWPNSSTALGEGRPIDEWLYREAERILSTYGNHPSFLLLVAGNEPAGPERGGKYLGPWVKHFKERDERRLVSSGSGWPSIAENDYHVMPAPRIQGWGQGLASRINALPPETETDYREIIGRYDVPVVSHEIGQWCVYPDFEEMAKYTGSLKPRNFEIFRDLLDQAGMLDQAEDFLMASGKLQALCYKEEIESALRTPDFGGFQLLDLHDFPGQGTALVGVLDPFWDSKPYISPKEFHRFCGATVPLVRMAKRTWTGDETFTADVDVSHFGPTSFRDATARWTVDCDGKTAASGSLAGGDIPTGELTRLGRIEIALGQFRAAAKLTLTVEVESGGERFANDWGVWVYPAKVDADVPDDIAVVEQLDDAAIERLSRGGMVLLLPDPRGVDTNVSIGFSSIFWNTAWTNGQPPQTLGVLCDPGDPALAAFPTEYHSDWQWWELVSRSRPMELDGLPADLRPIVQVVPDWFHPKRLGLVFEARIGDGRLLVSSIDLKSDLADRPAAKQMLASLLQYMKSPAFAPQCTVTADQVRGLFREIPNVLKLGAVAWADSRQRGYWPALAIDGDRKSIWHTAWQPEPELLPHWLMLDLKRPVLLSGVLCVPRADQANGRIAAFEVYAGNEAKKLARVATGRWSNDDLDKIVHFDQPVNARYVKLVATEEVNGGPWTSLAEIDVVPADDGHEASKP